MTETCATLFAPITSGPLALRKHIAMARLTGQMAMATRGPILAYPTRSGQVRQRSAQDWLPPDCRCVIQPPLEDARSYPTGLTDPASPTPGLAHSITLRRTYP